MLALEERIAHGNCLCCELGPDAVGRHAREPGIRAPLQGVEFAFLGIHRAFDRHVDENETAQVGERLLGTGPGFHR